MLGKDSVTKYVCNRGSLREANEMEIRANRGCTGANWDEVVKIDYSYYRCRDRWKYYHDSLYRDTITDARDGKKYPLIGMGQQLWFASYLNFETDSSWCYNDSTENCDRYGRIYRLAEVAQSGNTPLCPNGFHAPSKDEFDKFSEFVAMWTPSGKSSSTMLKSVASGGEDYFGFNALLAGFRDDGHFGSMGLDVYMCTQGLPTANSVRRWRLATDLSFTYETVPVNNTCYIRCVAD